MTPTQLAARCEAAEASEQRELLEQAWELIHPRPEILYDEDSSYTAEAAEWLDISNPFDRKLDAEAFESAALMLVPEEMILRRYVRTKLVPHSCEVSRGPGFGGWDGNSDHSFALALAAAALKAWA